MANIPPPIPPYFPNPQSDDPQPALRIVIYHQTHFRPNGDYVSLRPLLDNSAPITHLILAAIHINENPSHITLNDDPPDTPRNEILWKELKELQVSGIPVLGMLGGAAKGSFLRLDGDLAQFETYYTPLRNMIRSHGLDGLDLDVEEEMSLEGVIRLIDRLKFDFGLRFLITLAPVATALMGKRHLSGFNYVQLEIRRGNNIAWYNTQFYCGWGSMANTAAFDFIIGSGWKPERVVIGLLTNPRNAESGYVEKEAVGEQITRTVSKHGRIGGVMGWEYYNSLPGDEGEPWKWAEWMFSSLWAGVN
jgi:chitinase